MRIADARRADGPSTALAAAAALLALLLAVLLSGCASIPDPKPTLTPTATNAAPLFASDEEALAAATEAYAAYVSVADQIFAEGGEAPERMSEFASASLTEFQIDGFRDVSQRGLRSTGSTSFSDLVLQEITGESSVGGSVLTAYTCLDISKVDVLDASGDSIVSPNRPDRTAFEVSFELASKNPIKLVVFNEQVWDGGGICE